MVQQKIEEYLDSRSIQYVFKNPVYIAKKNRFFFVDYFVPGYNVLIDIRPVLSSEYFDAVKEKERRRCMKSLKSKYRYQVIDFDDIIKKRYITKLDRQFDSVYNIYKL
ncbi:MAG: hypothetical protein J6N19_16035 [Clostridium sp.]|nr:hypothetical protein [Clostridium sp.]